MCGRFVLSQTSADLAALFDVDEVGASLPPISYNIAPTDPVPIVVESMKGVEDGLPPRRRLEAARWGLVPSWSKDPSGAARMINARIESVAEKPAFRASYEKRRAAIPATGYYEWHTDEAGTKVPHFISAGEGSLILFAGLYEWWRAPAPGSPWLLTASILTQPSSGPLGAIHDRMPVFLDPELLGDWLDPLVEGDAELLGTVAGAAAMLADDLDAYPVGPEVGNVRNNGPELVRRADTLTD
ncbi:SOS response-associated peptidase [Microbacteriaceae bacterium VKM Ac-2855]|nr:SOS response-associated peptidase [Microbacteriaceae bacterium VKM Ac-2855]